MKKNIKIVGLAFVGMLLLSSCAGDEAGGGELPSDGEDLVLDGETIAEADLYAAAKEEGTLTLYDNYPEGPWREILDVFEDETGVTVEHVRLVTPQLYERVVSEAGAGQLAADVVGHGDITLMTDMAERGILDTYESPMANHLDETQYSEDHDWYMSANLVMVPAYNDEIIERDGLQVPSSWQDLGSPEWSNIVGVTPIETGGSSFSAFHFMQDRVDGNFWKTFAENSPRLYESVTPLTQDIVRGEIPMGITSLGTIATQRADGAPITPVFLEEGTPAFSNLVAITAEAESPNAARLYVDWLLSKHGQNVLVELTSEYPVREDANAPSIEGIEVPSTDSGEIVVPPLDVWVDTRDELTEEWNATFR